MVEQYITSQSLLGLCEGVERDPRARLGMRLWEQVNIELTGTPEAAEVTADGDRGE